MTWEKYFNSILKSIWRYWKIGKLEIKFGCSVRKKLPNRQDLGKPGKMESKEEANTS